MRIVYIHQYFVTPGMSGGTRSYEMARRLVGKGHQVDLITSDQNPAPGARGWRVSDEGGIRVHWYPVPYSNKLGFFGRVKAFLKFSFAASVRAASLKSDVVFATSTPLTIAIPAIIASRVRRVPMVFEVRDLWPEVPVAMGAIRNPALIALSRLLELIAYRSASMIIALSPGMKKGVENRGIPAHKVVMVPNASDLELFRVDWAEVQKFREKFDWLQGRKLVSYVGTIGAANGVLDFVRLATAVSKIDPEIRFVVAGDGKLRPAAEALARQTGVIGSSLFFLGNIKKDQVPALLGASQLSSVFFAPIPELENCSPNKLVPPATGWVDLI